MTEGPSRPQQPDPRTGWGTPSAPGAPQPGTYPGEPWQNAEPRAVPPAQPPAEPPAQRGTAPHGQREVLRGRIVGHPDLGDGTPPAGWQAPEDWAPPQPGHAGPRTTGSGTVPGGEPDWEALADRSEAEARRRRRLLWGGGGGVAVLAVAGAVAAAVVLSGGGSPAPGPTTAASGHRTGSAEPSLPPAPSFSPVSPPPPANPLTFLSSAKKDTAPLSAAGLFPGKKLEINGHTYTKTALADTTSCASAATGTLSAELASHHCRRMLRATYTRDGFAVTVGVAVFDDKATATALKDTTRFLAPLPGGGVGVFCHAVACQLTSNTVGRYAYFTITGRADGTTLTAVNPTATSAGSDTSTFAFNQIVQRGRTEATASTATASASPTAS
jgi:hypothetical protein